MHIEEELENWLAAFIPDESKDKARNMEVVLTYYGFRELPRPTYEEIGKQLVLVRERVRQVINESFRDHVKLDQLSFAKRIFELIESQEFTSIPEIKSQLFREGLASEHTTIRGLLTLARDLGACSNFDLYDSSLEPLSRSEAVFDGNGFLIRKDIHTRLKKDLKKARTLPGLLGLAKFEYLRSELESESDIERLISIIRCTPNVCTVRERSDDWYMFEDRDNTLINSCEKIYGLTEQCSVAVLSLTLTNALRRRSNKYSYPDATMIAQWIEHSKWFVVEGSCC